jgi:2-C-methyl-D-erythritol 4-phosphate cytidylyltransferase
MGKSPGSRKQFLPLEGVPIFLYTLRKFVDAPSVTDIFVAVRGDDIEWTEQMIAQQKFSQSVRVVEGGDARQASVEKALRHVDPSTDLVAVHDAVRPFIDVETIEHAVRAAAESGAAIVGIVPVDTVKQVGPSGSRTVIRATIPRDRLVLAQTPQVFRYDLLLRAFETARADGFIGTDEASLIERLEEVEVTVVPGTDRNIKITKPGDLELARLLSQFDHTGQEKA